MRNLVLFLMVFFNIMNANAQCKGSCGKVEMNFPSCPNGDCVAKPWFVSHGSPSVGPGYFWLWSHTNKGEGVNYSGYNFVAGRKYCITFSVNTATRGSGQTHPIPTGSIPAANPGARFNIVLTQNAVIGAVTSSNGGNISAEPAGSQPIRASWSTFGHNPYPRPSTQVTHTFTATSNFGNIWFYPSSPSMPQVEIMVSNLIICDVTEPPCNANFTAKLDIMSQGGGSLQINPTTPGFVPTNVAITKNGSNFYNGTNLSHVLDGGNYKICLTGKSSKGTTTTCSQCIDICVAGKDFKDKSQSSEDGNTSNIKLDVIKVDHKIFEQHQGLFESKKADK
jgi:hypothetical protein